MIRTDNHYVSSPVEEPGVVGVEDLCLSEEADKLGRQCEVELDRAGVSSLHRHRVQHQNWRHDQQSDTRLYKDHPGSQQQRPEAVTGHQGVGW